MNQHAQLAAALRLEAAEVRKTWIQPGELLIGSASEIASLCEWMDKSASALEYADIENALQAARIDSLETIIRDGQSHHFAAGSL